MCLEMTIFITYKHSGYVDRMQVRQSESSFVQFTFQAGSKIGMEPDSGYHVVKFTRTVNHVRFWLNGKIS